MKAWKQLEVWLADYLGWTRLTKKHYGHITPDLEGDNYLGDAKHYKKMRIISLSDEMNWKYKRDIILFLKRKGEHYNGKNIRVVMNLDQFKGLIDSKRIVRKLDNKSTNVLNSENNKLTLSLNGLRFRINICKDTLRAMDKMVKELQGKQQEVWVND